MQKRGMTEKKVCDDTDGNLLPMSTIAKLWKQPRCPNPFRFLKLNLLHSA